MDTRQELNFAAAINPYGCSPKVVEALQAHVAARQYRHYGDATAHSLRGQLAAHHQLTPANLVVYNGSGEALAWLFVFHLLLPQGRLIMPAPTYERFVAAGRRCAAEVLEVPLTEEFALSLGEMIDTARKRRASIGLISSPNNPTGNLLLDEPALKELLAATPDCLWIIDEAYADYPAVSFVGLVPKYNNLVVLRTFSKAYGLAGLRVGYAVGQEKTLAPLATSRLPWCVNSLSLTAALAALQDQDYMQRCVTRIRHDCAALKSALTEISGLRVCSSDSNFFLLELSRLTADFVQERLRQSNITVRSRPDMPRHIRVTSLLPAENQILLAALRSIL